MSSNATTTQFIPKAVSRKGQRALCSGAENGLLLPILHLCWQITARFVQKFGSVVAKLRCSIHIQQRLRWWRGKHGLLFFCNKQLGGGFKHCFFLTHTICGNDPIWRSYFSDGWRKTTNLTSLAHGFLSKLHNFPPHPTKIHRPTVRRPPRQPARWVSRNSALDLRNRLGSGSTPVVGIYRKFCLESYDEK